MTVLEIGNKLVELSKQGKNLEAIQTLYSPNIVSVEAMSTPEMPAEMRGMEAILGKNKWWFDNHTVHSASCEGPFPHGDRFIVRFSFDITNKPMQRRMQMDEMGLYTVEGGKIVREEYFYNMG